MFMQSVVDDKIVFHNTTDRTIRFAVKDWEGNSAIEGMNINVSPTGAGGGIDKKVELTEEFRFITLSGSTKVKSLSVCQKNVSVFRLD